MVCSMSEKTTRRKFLSTSAVGLVGALAGCAGSSNDNSTKTSLLTTSKTTTTSARTSTQTPTSTTQQTTTDTPSTTQEPTTTDDSRTHEHQTDDSSAGFSDETLKKAKKVGVQVQKSVVRLGGGTGWVLGDGYVVTNSHVVQHSDSIRIEAYDGQTGTAKRVGYHEDSRPDVALVKTDMTDLPGLPTKNRDDLEEGQPLITVRNPMSVGSWVISIGRYDSYDAGLEWLLSTVVTESGNSGGPLVTLDGNVVGCISGGTPNDNREKVNRSKKVFTEYPANRTLATAAPMRTIRKWVQEWK